ncbi:MAG: hypothetical protein MRZ84_01245, partial [Eubacterium sp.]|nr:hypothetical protein [Eubacterium sp.]
IPSARLILLMVTDTTIDKSLSIDVQSTNKRIKNKQFVNITFSDEIYNIIVEMVEKIPHYSVTKYVIDCIEYQIDNFSEMLSAKNHDFTTRRRITNSNEIMRTYSEETKEKYSIYVPLDKYIATIEEYSGIKSGYIKKYYLAKQINSNLSEYGDNEREIFANVTEYNNF